MKPDFSEFSYGYALTSDLMTRLRLRSFGAPRFPSQFTEGQAGGGYDVQLPQIPVFVQFKVSDVLTTRNSLDHRRLGLPYYRFKLRARKYSGQHDLLLALEEERQNSVFYAAPRFHLAIDLNESFSNRCVADRSVFVKPSSIGPLPDDRAHSLSYKRDAASSGIFRSSPNTISLSTAQSLLKAPARRNLQRLDEELVEIYSSRRSAPEAARAVDLSKRLADQEHKPLDRAHILAVTLFDLQLLIHAPNSLGA